MWTHQIKETNPYDNIGIVKFFIEKGYRTYGSDCLLTGRFPFLVIDTVTKTLGGNYDYIKSFGKLVTFAEFKKEVFPVTKIAYFWDTSNHAAIEIAVGANRGVRYFGDGVKGETGLGYKIWSSSKDHYPITRQQFRQWKKDKVIPVNKKKQQNLSFKIGDIVKCNQGDSLIMVITEIFPHKLFNGIVLDNKGYEDFEIGLPQNKLSLHFFTKITPKWD